MRRDRLPLWLTALALSACADEAAKDPRPEQPDIAAEDTATAEEALPRDGFDRSKAGVEREELVEAPFGTVRITELAMDGPHSASGRLDVMYLDAAGVAVDEYPGAVVMGSWGRMSDWSIRRDFGDYPVVVAQGGWTGQGQVCNWTSLTELRPDGPVELLSFMDYASNDNMGGEVDEVTGAMGNPQPDGTLTVSYTGTRNFTSTYRRTGNAYERVSGEELEGC